MNSYSILVCLHVITAILGLGPLTALAVMTSRNGTAPLPLERIAGLLRIVGWSLAGVLASGAGIIATTHGVLGEVRWVRVSFALFVLLGALHGLARRQLRRAALSGGGATAADHAPARALNWILWAMCVVVAAITWLMEAKP